MEIVKAKKDRYIGVYYFDRVRNAETIVTTYKADEG
jgi:hypothetical protein